MYRVPPTAMNGSPSLPDATYLPTRRETELRAEPVSSGIQVPCAVDHVVQLDHASKGTSCRTLTMRRSRRHFSRIGQSC